MSFATSAHLTSLPIHVCRILVAVAFAKLVAISITVLAGFRGGFIFPARFCYAVLCC